MNLWFETKLVNVILEKKKKRNYFLADPTTFDCLDVTTIFLREL